MTTQTSINDNGDWKRLQQIYINENGDWKRVTNGWINENGVWKRFHAANILHRTLAPVVYRSGTHSVSRPANFVSALVEVWGAGGGGGDCPYDSSTGGGGGGGGYCRRNYTSLSSSTTFTVGSGGERGRVIHTTVTADARGGEDSTFLGMTADGGTGGGSEGYSSNWHLGRGGGASGGDYNEDGGDGGVWTHDDDEREQAEDTDYAGPGGGTPLSSYPNGTSTYNTESYGLGGRAGRDSSYNYNTARNGSSGAVRITYTVWYYG